MINYQKFVNNGEQIKIILTKNIKVNKEVWVGFGLYDEENYIICNLNCYAGKSYYLVCITCGGKHFFRKINQFATLKEAEDCFMKYYRKYWCKIPENVAPEWFEECGWEWV